MGAATLSFWSVDLARTCEIYGPERWWEGAAAATAADFVPSGPASLDELRAAAGCRGCDLYENATQTVFGDGGERADAGIDRTRAYVTNVGSTPSSTASSPASRCAWALPPPKRCSAAASR